jgi:hypothetical protein
MTASSAKRTYPAPTLSGHSAGAAQKFLNDHFIAQRAYSRGFAICLRALRRLIETAI